MPPSEPPPSEPPRSRPASDASSPGDARPPADADLGASRGGPVDAAAVELLPSARHAEARLLALVDGLLPPRLEDYAVLAAPVRILVPSASLRRHLLARLLEARGAAMVGVSVQTLSGLVAELLGATGMRTCDADPLLPVLVDRHARDAPGLGAALAGLDDGLQVAVGPVADLLDAGFDRERDAVLLAELLRRATGGGAARLLALGLVEVAARVQADIDAAGLTRRADRTRRAAALLADDPAALPARAWLLHGFVDPAPADLALLDVLARLPCARTLIVTPGSGSAATDSDDDGVQLAARLAGGRPLHRPEVPLPGGPVAIDLAAAPGRRAEARHCARRIRSLLDAGQPPESIAVVIRDPGQWTPVLRPELDRLGIPYSGVGARAPAGPAQRRLAALSSLLRQGPQASVDRWLDAAAHLPGTARTSIEDLRLALHSLGMARVGDVAALDVGAILDGSDSLALPSRSAIQAEDAGEARVRRHRLPRFALEAAVEAATLLLDGLQGDGARSLRQRIAGVESVAAKALGWADPDAAWRALRAATAGLVDRIGRDLPVTDDELRLVLEPALLGAAAGPVGGQGGGVRLLSAVEARGACFAHLFVLGLSRGEFPRAPRPDPLLADPLRDRIAEILPDLSRRRQRARLERGLVAHLLGSAAAVHLSWPYSDDDGRLVPVSPLVEALRLARPELAVTRVPVPGSRADPPDALRDVPRPPIEHATRAASYGEDDATAVALAALAVGDNPGAAAVADARARVRRELDAAPGSLGLGPYLGMVGPAGPRDPRSGPVGITTLEKVATCGWQAFLGGVLRLEPPPGGSADLPAVDARLIGIAVHAVLERLVRSATGFGARTPSLSDALRRDAAAVPWPAEDQLDALVDDTCADIARQEGLGLPGLWRLLARRVRPYLDVARSMDWHGETPSVLAVELEGRLVVDLEGAEQEIGFRADRADRTADGQVVLTDYKTGRPLSTARSPSKRDEHLFAALATGQRMQAAVYARAGGEGAIGRYLFLRPDVVDHDDRCREAALPGGTLGRAEVMERLDLVLRRVLGAWQRGGLPPRLVDDEDRTPQACGWCDLRAACLQGDSTARQRLAAWAAAEPDAGRDEAAGAWALWHIAEVREDDTADPRRAEREDGR